MIITSPSSVVFLRGLWTFKKLLSSPLIISGAIFRIVSIASFKTKGMSGKHTSCHAIYGYLKSPEDREQWIVDPEAAEIVKRIFSLTIEGFGPYSIAAKFHKEKILCPGYYLALKGVGNHNISQYNDPYKWNGTSVKHMIGHAEYMGMMVNFKTYKKNYKDKLRYFTSAEERVIFENKHEAIIEPEVWHLANEIRQKAIRRRPNRSGEPRPFSGFLYCSDCGAKMHHTLSKQPNGKNLNYYTCSAYNQSRDYCTGHRINTESLSEIILDSLRNISKYAKNNEAEFTRRVNEMFSSQQSGTIKAQRKKLDKSIKRHDDLDRIIQRIYEDMVAGRITDNRFDVLSGEYEREQAELKQSILEMQADVNSFNDSTDRADKFLTLTRRYNDFTELTASMIGEFIQKVIIHERNKKNSQNTVQKVEIYFNFIEDFIPPTIPESEETDTDPAQAEKERKRAYHNDYYKRRKENDGKPLTPPDTRTPEQIIADEAERQERNKLYQRNYQREYQRRKAKEKREANTAETGLSA